MYSIKFLLLFSLPSIFSSLLEPLASVIDTALVGNLDTKALAALGINATIFSSFTWMFNFLVHASTTAVASVKEDDDYYKNLNQKIKISLVTAFVVGIFATALMWIFREQLFRLASVSDEIYEYVFEYFEVRIWGHIGIILYLALLSLLRGVSQVRLCFGITFFTTALNIVLSYILLYRFDMGVRGVAIGTVLSNVVGMLLCLFFLFRYARMSLYLTDWKLPKGGWLSFKDHSLSLFGRSFCLTSCFFVATKVSSYIGVTELATHQVLIQVWLFVSFLVDGIAISGNILGAKHLASGEIELVKKIYGGLLKLGFVVGAVSSVIFFIFSGPTIRIFTSDPKVIALSFSVWWLIWGSQIANSLAFVYDGLIFGLGRFDLLFRWMSVGVFFVFLPFAFYAYHAKNFSFLWIGLVLLNVERLASGFFIVRKELV